MATVTFEGEMMGKTKQCVTREPRYEVYPDSAGEWRWRLKAANNRIIADGAEGYSEKRHAYRAVYAIAAPAVRHAIVVEVAS